MLKPCSYFAAIIILDLACHSAYADNDHVFTLQEINANPRLSQQLNNEFPNYSDNNTRHAQKNSYRTKRIKSANSSKYFDTDEYVPQKINHSNKVIIINPRTHTWAAYSSGKLLRSGVATAGASWCPDIGRSCRTKTGDFKILSLGSSSCKSSKYPVGEGGAPMPYCMYFNGHQALHGSYQVVRGNVSHGCVRMTVDDARWVRFNFATIGTKVVVKSY